MFPKSGRTVYIRSVDICKRSVCHIEKIKNYLEINKYMLVSEPEQADNVLFFACSFNSTTEKNALSALEEFKDYRGNLFVLEGIADTSQKKLEKLGVDHKKIIGRGEYEKLDEFFGQECKFTAVEEANKVSIGPRELFFVHACQGCKSNCSYCGEKIIVKELKSKPIQDCIQEIEKGISLGFKSIQLIGDDLGAYGLDIGSSFMELLRAVMRLEGNFELSLEEINIKYLVRNLRELDEILSFGRIKRLLCGLQSANNRILKLMNREYTRREMQDLVDLLSGWDIEIYFHMIVGFPTETFEEFNETLSFIKNNDFEWGVIFKYQDRDYISSRKIFPKISEKEICSRLKHAIKYLDDRYQVNIGIADLGKELDNPEKDSDRLYVRKKHIKGIIRPCKIIAKSVFSRISSGYLKSIKFLKELNRASHAM